MLHLPWPPEGGSNVSVVAHSLRGGAVAVIPTDTLYGFSARYDRPSAIRRIGALKGSEDVSPFLVLVSGVDALALLTPAPPPPAVVGLLWPGPVTLLMPARRELIARLRGPDETVAVRWPADPLTLDLLTQVGVPLISTSVNRHREPPLADPAAIAREFSAGIDLLADAGSRTEARPSTIIDLTRRPPIEVRHGAASVDLERLDRLLG